MKLKIVGLDPSLTHTGIAIGEYDTDTRAFVVKELRLVVTENEKGKLVRQNSDDLRRARMVSEGIHLACDGALFAVSEVPTGPQSARAALAFGMVIGILANVAVPLIQVTPSEVKMAAVGHRQASKEEMIVWAMNKHPLANWPMQKKGGKMIPIAGSCEHLADGVAVVEAGLLTDQWKNAIQVLTFQARAA
jgi:Holliday junction resolvasome RuvABC endonuclease subunit